MAKKVDRIIIDTNLWISFLITKDLFDVYGEMVDVKSDVDHCRDKKDDFLLALAKDSRADFLVTGDKDLLEFKVFESTKIVTAADYLRKIK